eukprot:scaffold472_cov264-Pinguiococcus_pyrenoidosus.AAC.9
MARYICVSGQPIDEELMLLMVGSKCTSRLIPMREAGLTLASASAYVGSPPLASHVLSDMEDFTTFEEHVSTTASDLTSSSLAQMLGQAAGHVQSNEDIDSVVRKALSMLSAVVSPRLKKRLPFVTHEEISVMPNGDTFAPANAEYREEVVQFVKKVRECFGSSTVEGIVESLHERGNDPWAKRCLAYIDKASPLALKATLALLNARSNEATEQAQLHEAIIREHTVLTHLTGREDFRAMVEGQASGLPASWAHKSFADVRNDEVQQLFDPLPEGDALTMEELQEAAAPAQSPTKRKRKKTQQQKLQKGQTDGEEELDLTVGEPGWLWRHPG